MIRSRVRRALPATTVYTSLLLLIDFYISILERMTFTFTKLRNVRLPVGRYINMDPFPSELLISWT